MKMKYDGYSENYDAYVEMENDRWVIRPDDFAAFVAVYSWPDEVALEVPSFAEPDVYSRDPFIALASWRTVMSDYFLFSGDAGPYEFEYSGDPLPVPAPDPTIPEDAVY
jgi:hypothetical protein